jgi:hypothetical protein
MNPTKLDDILDDRFLGCALTAFLEIARSTGRMPDQEATRQLAYRLYEQALAGTCPSDTPMLTEAASVSA